MKHTFFLFVLLVFINPSLKAQTEFITTICGLPGDGGYNGDGIPANTARLFLPYGISTDDTGNILIADLFNNRIRKISVSTGYIWTIAGSDSAAFSGDGGPATLSQLNRPGDIKTDDTGNLYIADMLNNRIRKINAFTGIINTFCGSDSTSGLGDGGPATAASLYGPTGICFDKHNDLLIADFNNERIRRVEMSTGIITTIAGTGSVGYTGDGGPATAATLHSPVKICIDTSGNILFSDRDNNAIRKISNTTGIITTIAGTGTAANTGDGGEAGIAGLNTPYGVFTDSNNNIYIATQGAVRFIDGSTGIISTIAGVDTPGFSGDGGLATAAQVTPYDICLDHSGNLLIADFQNNRIRKLEATLNIPNQCTNNQWFTYPMPVHEKITLVKPEEQPNSVTLGNVFDSKGALIYQFEITGNTTTLTVNDWLPGIYFIDLVTRDFPDYHVKLVKE